MFPTRIAHWNFLAAVLSFFVASAFSVARADTYVVTNTNVTGPGSLAQAISDSNGRTGPDTIAFNIPGSGVHLIDLSQSSLPEITDSVTVDGYTQPGARPNTLNAGNDAVILIQLDGGLVKRNGRGLVISGSNCLVRGLSLTGFQFDPSSDPFFFRVLGGFGIQLRGAGTGNVIQGNFIGLKPDGITPTANYTGVRVEAAQSTIGGVDPAQRNVISGNNTGIEIQYPSAVITGNYIGTDAAGARAVGNGGGIEVAASDAVIGGTSAGAGNLISGNNGAGIQLGYEVGYHTLGHADRGLVQGNVIGTAVDRFTPLGNGGEGVSVAISSNSTVGGLDQGAGNLIAFNGYGVGVGGTGNRILSNSIFSNSGRGIRFYSAGSNNGQSFPVITSQSNSPRAFTRFNGTLHSTPNTPFLLQFFNESQSLISSKQTYLGSDNVTTDGNGNATFFGSYAVSDSIPVFNITATDPGGNTSEFSRNVAYLQNISTRAAVGTGDNALIGGFIAGPGEIVLRGLGPSLQGFGFDNVLADPVLELHDQTGAQIEFNDNWQDNQYQAGEAQRLGLAPTQPAESAIVLVPFGRAYTAVLRGKNDTSGVGLIEVYGPGVPLSNLSSRGLVGRDGDVLIGGFIVTDGNINPRIAIRAIGPSLKSSNIINPLSDPVLELHNGDGATINSNDDWNSDSHSDALRTVGLAPTDSRESAIFTRLAPGAYTAVVHGKDTETGVALVEVYDLP
jgi:hypothetical protein